MDLYNQILTDRALLPCRHDWGSRTDCSVCTGEDDDFAINIMVKRIAELTAECDGLKSAQLVPGEMYCAKCKFGVIRTNLYLRSGTTGPGDNETEPCPNGCGPLWPVTWEKSARDSWKTCEEIFEREQAEKARHP